MHMSTRVGGSLLALFLIGILLLFIQLYGELDQGPPMDMEETVDLPPPAATWLDTCYQLVRDSALYTQGWDKLEKPAFWRHAMELSPDCTIVNIAKNRQIIAYLPTDSIRAWSAKRKRTFEDSLRRAHRLSRRDEIYFTGGRNHFYRFDRAIPHVSAAIPIFEGQGVDPWYAQTILLIESPGRLQLSTTGAYGAFQLMAGVAREVGLTVNDSIDERTDFAASAKGAARLIQTVCIPKARAMCEFYRLPYTEDELWFRLLVMHIYHAGAGNVRRALRKIKHKEAGPQLIIDLWEAKSRRFGNASQNYSQIALAALLEVDELADTFALTCEDG